MVKLLDIILNCLNKKKKRHHIIEISHVTKIYSEPIMSLIDLNFLEIEPIY